MTTIIHLSLAAAEPKRVAGVLAELMDGVASPFGPVAGAYYVGTDSPTAAAIEVYPLGSEIAPGEGEGEPARFEGGHGVPTLGPVHVAMAVPRTRAEIAAIGAREGWRTLPCRRGGSFDVVEFWLENRLMLELVPESEAEATLAVLRVTR
jgi:hypothetical protein